MKYLHGVLLCAAILVSGCGEADKATRHNEFVPLTTITIESQYPRIADGTSNQFRAIGNFSDQFERDITSEVIWGSQDPTVLTINNRGLGHGETPGTARISATLDEVSGSLDFEVADATLQTLVVTPPTVDLPQGLTQLFTATGTFDSVAGQLEQTITGDVTWSSSDETIATINASGLATAVNTGATTITASFAEESGAITGNAALTVTAARLQTLSLTPVDPVLFKGETQQLTVTATYSDGSTQDVTSQASNWISSQPDFATVSSGGLVTAVASGNTTISTDFGGKTGSTAVLVTSITEIRITPSNPRVRVDDTLQLTATATLLNGNTKDITTQATWSITNTNASDTTTASTVDKGLVTAGSAAGTITVKASLNNIEGTIPVTLFQ